MPAFTLYSARGSSNADRVRLTLAEGGLTDFETVILDLRAGEQKVRVFRHYQSFLCTSGMLMVYQVQRKLQPPSVGQSTYRSLPQWACAL